MTDSDDLFTDLPQRDMTEPAAAMRPIRAVAQSLVRICPTCRQPLAGTAIVDALNDPPGWSFWGNEGARWIVCRAAGYVHFRVDVGRGQMQHRLAIIKPGVAPRPVINL